MMRVALSLIVAVGLTAGCTRQIDVKQAVRITDVSTGWYDVGIINGQNKLVPSISFKLQNADSDTVAGVQVNAIFRRVGEPDAWGEHYAQAVDRNGLAAGQTTNPIVLRSTLGYTGSEPRIQMLQNKQFVDARVDIFLKQGRGGWVKMAEYRIDRQLLTD